MTTVRARRFRLGRITRFDRTTVMPVVSSRFDDAFTRTHTALPGLRRGQYDQQCKYENQVFHLFISIPPNR